MTLLVHKNPVNRSNSFSVTHLDRQTNISKRMALARFPWSEGRYILNILKTVVKTRMTIDKLYEKRMQILLTNQFYVTNKMMKTLNILTPILNSLLTRSLTLTLCSTRHCTALSSPQVAAMCNAVWPSLKHCRW